MILHSPTEDENRHGLALTVIRNAVKDLLYVFDSKRITSRFFVAEFILSMVEGLLRRCDKSGRSAASLQLQFSKKDTKSTKEIFSR
jgi:hypothetical protein